jgi:hypothetical protein
VQELVHEDGGIWRAASKKIFASWMRVLPV